MYDFQYLLLLIVGIFSLTIIQSPGPLGKTAIATGLLCSLLMPITRQLFSVCVASWCWWRDEMWREREHDVAGG
jgi:hypothetical protein